jgi:HlyD family secretion protein
MIKNSAGGLGWAAPLCAGALVSVSALGGCLGDTTDDSVLQGVVELDERSLGFELPGQISEVTVVEGDDVEAGQVLARLDDTLAGFEVQARELELRAARAQLDLLRAGSRDEEVRAASAELRAAREAEGVARRSVDRQRTLTQQGAGTSAQLDRTTAEVATLTAQRRSLEERLRALRAGARAPELDVAEARVEGATVALEAARERVRRHALTAPIAATVLEAHLEVGEIVAPGMPVITAADSAHPFIEVFVRQADIGAVEEGATVRVVVDAYAEPFRGTVAHIARRTEFTPRYLFSESERATLVVRVRVDIDDPERRLHAGVPGFVTVEP